MNAATTPQMSAGNPAIYTGEQYANLELIPSQLGFRADTDNIEDAEIIEEFEMLPSAMNATATTCLHIADEVYDALANELYDLIENDGTGYIHNICIVNDDVDPEHTYELQCTALRVYYDRMTGDIEDIQPIWWEMHAYENDFGFDVLNDSQFDEIKKRVLSK